MSWTAVRAADEALLKRCTEIVTEASPFAPLFDVATLRAGIAHEAMHWFYYDGGRFGVALEFSFHKRRKCYAVCANFVGQVDPSAVVDLVLPKGQEFLAACHECFAYGVRPIGVPHMPIIDFYDCLLMHPGLRITTVARTSDAEIWRMDVLALMTAEATAG